MINSLTPLTGSVCMSQLFSAAHDGVPDTPRRLVSSGRWKQRDGGSHRAPGPTEFRMPYETVRSAI